MRTRIPRYEILLRFAFILLAMLGRPDGAWAGPEDRCAQAFEAAEGSPTDFRITLDSVRQTLREKNLARNLKRIAEEREALKQLAPSAAVHDAELALTRKYYDLMAECPSGRCATERTRQDLLRTGSIDLSPNATISYRTPELVAAVENSRLLPSAFILTHQVFDFTTDPTIRMLQSQPRFANMPRIVLGGDEFKVRSADLYRQATIVRYSSLGEFPRDLVVVAKDYHFAGGYCEQCLRRSIDTVMSSLDRGYRPETIFTFHANLMYWSSETLADHLRDALAGISNRERVEQIIVEIIGKMGSFSPGSLRLVSEPEENLILLQGRTRSGRPLQIRVER